MRSSDIVASQKAAFSTAELETVIRRLNLPPARIAIPSDFYVIEQKTEYWLLPREPVSFRLLLVNTSFLLKTGLLVIFIFVIVGIALIAYRKRRQ